MPFHHVMIRTNGAFNVCCQHDRVADMNINTHTATQWRESDYMKQIKQAFLLDDRHPGCKACWQVEDKGYTSLRQRTAGEYTVLGIDIAKQDLHTVEIDLTNLCNLKCLMCNEESSSAFLAENKLLRINQIKQKDIKWDKQAFANLESLVLQHPKILTIRGGEPFYIKALYELLNNIPNHMAKSMVIHVTTNCTVWNTKWQKVLSKFRLVRLMFSIDAVDKLYEYIRYPADWNTVQKNIQLMRSMPNAQCLVHCVLQNLNVSAVGDLISWCNEQSIWLNLDVIKRPSYLQPNNLPPAQIDLAVVHLKKVLTQDLAPHIRKEIENSLQQMQSSTFDEASWHDFEKNISLRDQIRGNSYRNFLHGLDK